MQFFSHILVVLFVIFATLIVNSHGAKMVTTSRVTNHAKIALKSFVVSVTLSNMLTHIPVFAAVGEGDLPDGAMAFSKVLKYQKDWRTLADSVKVRRAEMDEKEVLGIKLFLKQLANEYYDMELLSKGILDPGKAEQAKVLAKKFRTEIRECDDSASAGNLEKITENYSSSAKDISDFLELLQDVPDEI